MTQLFLCGGAEGKIKDLDELFVSTFKGNSNRMLYLPIAHPEISINGVKYTHKALFGWAKKYFSNYNIKNIDMWTDLSNKDYEDVKKYGAIYIGGGNTFDLLSEFRKSGFDQLLERYINNEGVVYGSSAGAIILGKNIGTAKFGEDPDTNRIQLKDLSGLNKAKGYAICCHYTKIEDEKIAQYVRENDFAVITLPSETGLHISNLGMKIIGSSAAYLFKDSKKIKLEVGKLLRQ